MIQTQAFTSDVVELPSHEPMGEVFTRRWVVEWMLDLAGYRSERPLHSMRALEPSCGAGAFLLPMVDRLLEACRREQVPVTMAREAILGVDLNRQSVDATREAVRLRLEYEGISPPEAEALALSWVRQADFLLDDDSAPADFVIGNPPYVRLEDVPPPLASLYRDRWRSMGGRADLYVGFFEKGLLSLREGGRLVFICADRWMRNSYGRGLRALITEGPYAVEAIVRLHDVACFEEDVSAYPAITVIQRGQQNSGVVLETWPGFSADDVPPAEEALRTAKGGGATFAVGVVDGWFGPDVWPEGTPEQLAEIADHESRHEPLEDPQRRTRVGIGVATGADRVFITEDAGLVEPERLLPMAMARHIRDGTLAWTPTYLVNPWDDAGLIKLADYPRLGEYLEAHRGQLASRHTARKTPRLWYKTIDRVNPTLVAKPKILLADMKARMTPVIDPGGLYPHHNLYWITSTTWDLEVLAGLLLSDQAELFVRAYCVKMRGGTLRMQAQYLRRIRLPSPSLLTPNEQDAFRRAFATQDRELATQVAGGVYAR